jgi:hypothetical protein
VTDQMQPDRGQPRTASEILSGAERLAEEIRGRAQADADAIRARAGSDSDAARSAIKERVQRLSELADGMLEQLAGMRSELDALSGSLAGDGADAPEPPVAGVAQVSADGVAQASADGVPEPSADGVAQVSADGVPEPPAAHPTAPEPPPADPAAPEPIPATVDDAGARLIALNLALSDTPRDEAARQLRDHVPDPERLVDEVYASVDR